LLGLLEKLVLELFKKPSQTAGRKLLHACRILQPIHHACSRHITSTSDRPERERVVAGPEEDTAIYFVSGRKKMDLPAAGGSLSFIDLF